MEKLRVQLTLKNCDSLYCTWRHRGYSEHYIFVNGYITYGDIEGTNITIYL